MKSKDLKVMDTADLKESIAEALRADASEEESTEALASTLTSWANGIQMEIIDNARGVANIEAMDAAILSQRGLRVLTTEETGYYNKVVEAMRSDAPKQGLTGLDVVMPKTIIDNVFYDLEQNHPLLSLIKFTMTESLIEIYYNTNPKQLATWDNLTSTITKELTSGFKKVEASQNKLSAWIPVANAMLDLGPVWIDRYVRTILSEALAIALENAIVDGDGNKKPIGMTRQVGENVTVTGGVYPRKTSKVVKSLDPTAYGELIADLAKTEKGNQRTVTGLVMIVNPVDYYKKIGPATTVLVNGQYINNVLPFPTNIVQSTEIEEGKAVLGIAERYFAFIGTQNSGKLEYSDEYKFLEDLRTYRIKLYGGGEPLDNTSFALLDISSLETLISQVKVVGTVKTEASA